jgi:NitT/TauT family transport system ATP-binding protein
MATSLLELQAVSKDFAAGEGRIRVLDRIDLAIAEGEIVALLGRSGCGKSTLLRVISGLTPASSGQVLYKGSAVLRPQPGISMVFQTFALFPWLTVLQNVAVGLEALGVPQAERHQRALQSIDMIGLDGFESAYPKELSGGMRQRVGFARALVVRPDVLLMDEAFSALDVPTTETLRNDLLNLWLERQIPTRAIVMVSHSIEEALLLADRIVILDSNPGRIKRDMRVELKHPRDRDSHAFRRHMDEIYAAMSGVAAPQVIGLSYRLPSARVGTMLGVLETVGHAGTAGAIELPALAEALQMTVDLLFPHLEALDLLGFAKVAGQHVNLTAHGLGFAEADIQRRKVIFGEHLLQRVPLAAHIRRVLDERIRNNAPKGRFLRELEDSLPEDEAERVLSVVTDWGRYAECFAYDADTGYFSLDNPGGEEETSSPD